MIFKILYFEYSCYLFSILIDRVAPLKNHAPAGSLQKKVGLKKGWKGQKI